MAGIAVHPPNDLRSMNVFCNTAKLIADALRRGGDLNLIRHICSLAWDNLLS
jgi:hypothetical protein